MVADDSHDVALFHLEVDVLEGPHVFACALVRAVVHFAHLEVGVLAAQHFGLPVARKRVQQERTCSFLLPSRGADAVGVKTCSGRG